MKVKIIVGLELVLVALVALCVIVVIKTDRIAPEIQIPEGDVTYTAGEDVAVLLHGVTARDNKDGDITSSVRVAEISVIEGGTKAVVVYAVYDKANNISKSTRIVNYIPQETEPSDPEEPSTEEEQTEEPTEEPTTEETATDTEAVPEGYDDPELISTGAPVIRLRTHEARVSVGSNFDSMYYVEDAVDDVDTRSSLYTRIYLEGYYGTSQAGEYELTYYCVDSAGNTSNLAKLRLIVE